MKKIFILLFAALMAAAAQAYVPQTKAQAAQHEALIAWVEDNSHPSVDEKQSKRIVDAAYRYASERELDVFLVLSIIRTESQFREKASAPAGGRGLMQVVPYWHRDKLRGRSVMNPQVNVDVGTQVLSDCKIRAKGNLLKTLSCYSGGGGQQYYAKVMKHRTKMIQYAKENSLTKFVQRL